MILLRQEANKQYVQILERKAVSDQVTLGVTAFFPSNYCIQKAVCPTKFKLLAYT